VALSCTFSFFGLMVRIFLLKKKMIPHEAIISFRQGILFAILIISCLFLSSQNLFKWWILAILICLLSAIEFFCSSLKKTL
jgi:diacylglycerol kinase